MSSTQRVNHARRKQLKKRIYILWWKTKECVRNLHWQSIRWMCDRYSVILMGKLETKKLASKTKRQLSKRSVRTMYQLSPYRYQRRLLAKRSEAISRKQPTKQDSKSMRLLSLKWMVAHFLV